MLLDPVIPQNEMNKERKVVLEEIRRSEDNPGRILYDNLNSLLFKYHPYRYETLGSVKLVSNMSREQVLNYHNKWYVPSNITTVIVGDVDTAKFLALVQKDFKSKYTYDKQMKATYKKEPYLLKPAEKIERGNYNAGYLMVGFKGVDIKDEKENHALDMAAAILGEGKNSRLYQDIKEKQGLATSIGAGHDSMRDDSIFAINADFKPENYAALKRAILAEVKRLRDKKVSPEELQRAKTQVQRQFIYSNESVANIANSIGYDMTIGGNLDYYTNYVNEINKVTAEDIQKVAQKYLLNSRRLYQPFSLRIQVLIQSVPTNLTNP